MKRFVKENALGLTFGLLFLVVLVGQAFAGLADYNQQQLAEGLQPIGFARYVTSASFGADVAENWQSEYLQFFLFIFLTVWLVQKGSPESKQLDKVGRESDKDQKVGPYAQEDSPKWAHASGFKLFLFSNSLGLVMGAIFVVSWVAQFIAGRAAFNEEQLGNLEDPMSPVQYLMAPDFWNRTLQNWQSELLAVASMAILAIYLRQRGSSQSKPVGSPHTATGDEN
ncbi:DUF6766 family protein [Nucisporomicrobium flavum]|uniref:DUF6766 family protein n=1 Tax=Nucisporomicrobium flavum TaxID=2785915 RepID=UPI0018F42E33|nr:DUF6766 family protein [Nucisporomicrobium flavum]